MIRTGYAVAATTVLVACSGVLGDEGDGAGAASGGGSAGAGTGAAAVGGAGADGQGGSSSGVGGGGTGGSDPRAFLHADLWSTWYNDRTRCGAERTFLNICQHRGGDCGLYQQAVAACDPWMVVYGQVGPEKQGEPLCQRGKFPAIGGCDASQYDFDALRFWWYGAEWQGNWPWATIKIFPQGSDWTGGGEIVALSSLPNRAESAMGGIDNHGLSSGCVMPSFTSGDVAYQTPFGAFAWVEVPVGTPVTVAAVAATNFGGQSFAGCSRGAPTQDPWIDSAPGATLGCVYVLENVVFDAGHHYLLRYGQLEELPGAAPPADLLSAFALPEVGMDVSGADACSL